MIAIISGSARSNSNTLKVAKAVKKIIELKGEKAEIISFEQYDVPNFNQPFDPKDLSVWQASTIKTLSEASVIFWLSPEYNWMPTAEVMQFINRFGSGDFIAIWNHKTMATIGISAGIGGRMPAITLKHVLDKVISFVNAKSHTVASIQEVHNTSKVMDAEGNLLDNEYFNASFTKFVEGVI